MITTQKKKTETKKYNIYLPTKKFSNYLHQLFFCIWLVWETSEKKWSHDWFEQNKKLLIDI